MRFFVFLTLCLCAVQARGQYEISLKLPRSNFMALEGITATVQITNRSGTTAVLGGPGRADWLSFEILSGAGNSLAQMDVDGSDLLQVPAGGTVQQKVVVTNAYAPADMGNYAIKARILDSKSGTHYESDRTRFSIIDNKPMWERSFGVPEGMKDAGAARRYALHIFRDFDSTSLYVRLIDDRTETRLNTYRLGPLSMIHDPQITLDSQNQLNVLFMAQAHVFAYAVVAPDGKLAKLAYYSDEKNGRPMMQQTDKGLIQIAGGEYFDPNKPEGNAKKVGGKPVSKRPPGL
ncbi:hypothetical protein [Brevifollis gellanilyticus]|nr:hypothetical protein [Brevifollis gellanilyticus]